MTKENQEWVDRLLRETSMRDVEDTFRLRREFNKRSAEVTHVLTVPRRT